MDELGAGRPARRPEALALGGRGFNQISHGESFLALLETCMRENGLFLLDEPKAAFSPQRHLSMLVLMHDVLRSHGSAQFLAFTMRGEAAGDLDGGAGVVFDLVNGAVVEGEDLRLRGAEQDGRG